MGGGADNDGVALIPAGFGNENYTRQHSSCWGGDTFVPRLVHCMFFFRCTVTCPFALVDVLVRRSVSPPQEGQNFKSIFFVILSTRQSHVLRTGKGEYAKHPWHRKTHVFTLFILSEPSTLTRFKPICNATFCMAKSPVIQADFMTAPTGFPLLSEALLRRR